MLKWLGQNYLSQAEDGVIEADSPTGHSIQEMIRLAKESLDLPGGSGVTVKGKSGRLPETANLRVSASTGSRNRVDKLPGHGRGNKGGNR